MPPSLPKGLLGSMARLMCSKSTIPMRSFTTSQSLAAIGPQNPMFIEIPQPPQQQMPSKLVIKGTLPPPRNIFPKRGKDKLAREYIQATIPRPKRRPPPTTDEFVAWKRRLAHSRRYNLRTSLKHLQVRKRLQDHSVARRSRARSEHRERLVAAPQREDERLTNPTITILNRTLQSGPPPDPDRAMRLAEKATRVAAKEAARENARRDALHTLYMNARSFITTEEQLNSEIEKIFTETPHDGVSRNQNIWNFGLPPSTQTMLSTISKTQKTAVDFHAGPGAATGERLKKIAEELTGGKMD